MHRNTRVHALLGEGVARGLLRKARLLPLRFLHPKRNVPYIQASVRSSQVHHGYDAASEVISDVDDGRRANGGRNARERPQRAQG